MKIEKLMVVFENCEDVILYPSEIISFKLKVRESNCFNLKNENMTKQKRNKKVYATLVVNSTLKIPELRRCDVTQLVIFFEGGEKENVSLNWGVDDCLWSSSSLQHTSVDEQGILTWRTGGKK